jgi:cell wall-associated NlpC family hydrolase
MNADAYAWINDYVGTPHKTNGRDRAGWDCWGLMRAVWREQKGIDLPDFTAPHDATFIEAVEAVGKFYERWPTVAPAVQVEAGADWDFVVVLRRGVLALHMGLVINRGVLHSANARGTVWEPESRFNAQYPGRAYWRWLA